MRTFTPKQVRNKIEGFIAQCGSQSAAAREAGCTPQQVSLALSGSTPCAKLLSAIGLQRVTVFTVL